MSSLFASKEVKEGSVNLHCDYLRLDVVHQWLHTIPAQVHYKI